ncbi:MAG: helix-turn-helix domain-containing protein [Clostridia bacterium]|nr:helix-turn-helix domain-containing protein [Clostridia bacterium]
MNIPNFESLAIPSEILFNKDLSDREKILLSIVLSLSRKSNFCYAGNKYISDIFNVTDETISRAFSSLKDKKYIKMNYNNKTTNSRKREIVPIKENIFKNTQNEQDGIDENDNGYLQNRQESIVKNNKEYHQNNQGGIVKNDKYINNNYINNNKSNNNIIKDIPNRYKTDQYDNIDWSQYYAN